MPAKSDAAPTLSLSLHPSIGALDPAEWDLCGGGLNPFVSHAFLSAVEQSGSTGKRTGWLPQHAVLRDQDGRMLAAAPMYAKSHSYGEYVFDHGWAQAFERAGGRYYPKLQVASPFSPVTGPRLLLRPDCGHPPHALASALAAGLAQACDELSLSSVHVAFCREAEYEQLGEQGWLQRIGTQFHWENADYADFEAFLASFNARKRKAVRRERREAQASGLEFVTLRGHDIRPHHWAAFHRFYLSTVDRKWGSAYLTEAFFPLLSQKLGDQVVLMLALKSGEPVAGALNLLGPDALYGRNWGCIGDWPFLHFELCYYRAIDFAIEHKLARVEAGAQGEHKIQRGYLPKPTWSAHWIVHPGLRAAIADYLVQERQARLEEMAELATLSPYRQEN